ncbi:MAG: hypothetical protein ACI828_001435 [Flavobacteriales bacterium]|jgi:hypothetical protein
MSPLIKKIVFSFILLLANISVFAQQTAKPPAPQRTPPVGLPMPIDGGVFLLLVLGAALGIWFYVKKNKLAKAI